MKKLLFLSYGGGHSKLLVNILHHIKQHSPDKYDIINIGLTVGAADFREAGYSVNGFADYVDASSDSGALRLGADLAREMHADGAGISYQESVGYLGLSMQDLIDRLGQEEAFRLFRIFKRLAFCPVSVMDRIIRRERPDVVITTNSPKSERAALVAARHLSIPSLRIEDLFGMSAIIRYLKAAFPNEVDKILWRVRPDRVAVMNDTVRQNVVTGQEEEGVCVETQHVRVTGQPVLDEAAFQGRSLSMRACRGKLSLPEDRPALLWAMDNSPVDEQIFQGLRRVFARRTDWFLMAKLHPGFTNTLKESYERQSLPNMSVMGTRNILECIAASRAVLTQFTTVGLETIAFGRPLLLIDLGPDAEIFRQVPILGYSYRATVPFIRPHASGVVRDLDLLEAEIEKVLNMKAAVPSDKSFSNGDNGSARRILAVIDELSA